MPDRPDMVSSHADSEVSKKVLRRLKGLSETSSLRAGLEFFRREREWISEQHLNICRGGAPTFREQARAEYQRALFRSLGHRAAIDEAGNIVLPIKFDDDLPFVAISAHMDTVLAPRGEGDISVRPDGTFEGPGVTDNGPGLAALVGVAVGLVIAFPQMVLHYKDTGPKVDPNKVKIEIPLIEPPPLIDFGPPKIQ